MRVLAHRGGAARGPENTVAAVRNAAPHVDGVEIDVRRCGSGEIVVFHDETLGRTTDGVGRLAETPLEELRDLRVGGGEPIPTLAELLAAVPEGLAVNVELKEAGIAAAVADLCEGAAPEVFVSSFRPAVLEEFRSVSTLPTALVFRGGWGTALDRAGELGSVYLHPSHRVVDSGRVDAAHERGFGVNVWTPDSRAAVSRVAAAGVDGVIVDDWELVG